jgi:hypothetical protein
VGPVACLEDVVNRTASVLLLADHAIAARDARVSLGSATRTRWARSVSEESVTADVVVLENTLAEPPTDTALTALAGRVGGAPILSVTAVGAGRYRWLRMRSTHGLFRIEASGSGTLAEAVREATLSGEAGRALDGTDNHGRAAGGQAQDLGRI